MTPKELEIKKFYDTIKFPGKYTADDVVNHCDILIYERYLKFFESKHINNMLDVGCGSGFVTNVIAYNNPNIQITALDFSDTIEHGKLISKELGCTNIEWKQINFFDFEADVFDLVLCNGSIHHMPNFNLAVDKCKSLTKKYLMLGLYNKYGKFLQRKIRPTFVTDVFELDQLSIPFELSFTHKEILNYFKDFELLSVTPSILNTGVDFLSLFRSKWGGFSFYVFKKKDNLKI